MALTLAGLAIGLGLAAIAARLMTTLFYTASGRITSPAVAVVSLVLLTVAALGVSRPPRVARRGIDPMLALQHE